VDIKKHAINKAMQSPSKYKISAIGLDHRGKVLGSTFNSLRFNRYGGGLHAEMRLIQRYRNNVKTIILCRVGRSGNILPIQPCERCAKVLTKKNITVITVE
jgi:cytidine deaminase